MRRAAASMTWTRLLPLLVLLFAWSPSFAPARAVNGPTPPSSLRMRGAAASASAAPWDLSGATILAAAPVHSRGAAVATMTLRVQWTPPTATQNPLVQAPPLRFTLFAEWTAASLQQHNVRVCEVATPALFECVVDAELLSDASDSPITLRLLTECDRERMDVVEAAAAQSLPTPSPRRRCLTSMSPPFALRMPSVIAEVATERRTLPDDNLLTSHQPQLQEPSSALPTQSKLVNDAWLFDTLCQFHQDTQSAFSQWRLSDGWCNSSRPVCSWHGLGCDSVTGELTHISLSWNGLVGALPSFARFPSLRFLRLDGNTLIGKISTNFLNESKSIHTIELQNNELSGSIPAGFTFPNLTLLDLSGNLFSGSLPLWSCPSLSILRLNNNRFSAAGFDDAWLNGFPSVLAMDLSRNRFAGASLPGRLWDALPRLQFIDISFASLGGSIPDIAPDAPQRMLSQINFANNDLVGPIPRNVLAVELDYSWNRLEGSVELTDFGGATSILNEGDNDGVVSINLGGNVALHAPIRLQNFSNLQWLELYQGGFACDFNDPASVEIPWSTLDYLDISNNAWTSPLDLFIPSNLRTLRARNASLTKFRIPSTGDSALEWLDLDENDFAAAAANGPTAEPALLSVALADLAHALMLRLFSCRSCNLAGPLGELLVSFKNNLLIETVDLANNKLYGAWPTGWLNIFLFTDAGNTTATSTPIVPTSWPFSLTSLDLSSNTRIGGRLGPISAGWDRLRKLELSNTGIGGDIPRSFVHLTGLSLLGLHNTATSCALQQGSDGEPQCTLPGFLTPSSAMSPLVVESQVVEGAHCPQIALKDSGRVASIGVDDSFYANVFCKCDAGWFGKNGQCMKCPDACSCTNSTFIRDCYPQVRLGTVRTLPDQSLKITQPFIIVKILPCPRTTNGSSLCNGDGARGWPQFYTMENKIEDLDASNGASSSMSSSSTPAAVAFVEANTQDWCFPGHTGRLCAACRAGFYASGNFCSKCLGTGLHVLIFFANIAVLCAMVAGVYLQQPSAAEAAGTLAEYLHEERDMLAKLGHKAAIKQLAREKALKAALMGRTDDDDEDNVVTTDGRSPLLWRTAAASSSSSSRAISASPSFQQHGHGGPAGHGMAPSSSRIHPSPSNFSTTNEPPPPSEEEAKVAQAAAQIFAAARVNPLNLLVTHMQQMGLLLLSAASLPQQLAKMLGVFSSAGTGFSLSSLTAMECLTHWTLRNRCWMALLAPALVALVAGLTYFRRRFRFKSRGVDPFALEDRNTQRAHVTQVQVSPIYGVCAGVLYLLVFPCAQTALSALACTDWREAVHLPKSVEPRYFLNLFPNEECDAKWRAEVVPPAVLAVLFWVVFFPCISTWLLRRLHTRLVAACTASEEHPLSEKDIRGTNRLWSLGSELLQPYTAKRWYWEQILLMRRLLLAAVICLVPATSLYLPMLLLTLIQLSALAQHWAQPYRSKWMNKAELASLYLLLLNFASALVVQAAVTAGTANADSDFVWAILLFILNLAFMMALLGGLFRFVRAVLRAKRLEAQAVLAKLSGGIELILEVTGAKRVVEAQDKEEREEKQDARLAILRMNAMQAEGLGQPLL